MYHSVSASATSAFQPFITKRAVFEEHMAALAAAGYNPITISEYIRFRNSGLPSKAVVLTFDDAYLDFHTSALRILNIYGFRSTLYVPTAYVGQTSRWLEPEGEGARPIMSWNALREVADAGVEIGSHSQSHCELDLVDDMRMRTEVRDSKKQLEEQLQRPVESFAYPYGYYTKSVRSVVVDSSYTSACAVRDLLSDVSDPFTISRWTVKNGLDARALIACLEKRTGFGAQLRSDSARHIMRTVRRCR